MVVSGGTDGTPPRPTRQVLLSLTLGGVGVALVVAELALRLLGFRYTPYPVVQFGWPDPQTIVDRYEADADLLWVTRGYQALLAAARTTRPAVVFMGDSCTEFGAYPRRTLELLAERRRSLADGIAVGVGGWSVVQGWRQLERDILPLRPRVVTIYFGWNDHWVALGPPDAEIHRGRAAAWLSDRVRLVQLVDMLPLGKRPDAESPNRVDPDTYEGTLERMVRAVRDSGGAAVLVTAPSAHVRGQEPE